MFIHLTLKSKLYYLMAGKYLKKYKVKFRNKPVRNKVCFVLRFERYGGFVREYYLTKDETQIFYNFNYPHRTGHSGSDFIVLKPNNKYYVILYEYKKGE